MDNIRERATEQFPTVLLTLLSIVQALALEFLWTHLHERTDLYEVSGTALFGWLQIGASLNGIILIWLTYAGLTMRFRWTPSTMDSVMPFFVGIVEFLMIDMMGPGKVGPWLVLMTVIFSTMIAISYHVMRRARRDSSNKEFFDLYAPATLRDFMPHITLVSVMGMVAVWLWASGRSGWPAFVALIGIILILAIETRAAVQYWNRSMGSEPGETKIDD